MRQVTTPDRQVIRKGTLKYALGAGLPPAARVEPGEVFEVETELNIGGHLITSLDDRLTEKDVTLPFVNPATGPIMVNGAKPGDMLTVTVHDVGLRGLGYTALWPGIGIFPDWARRKEFGIRNRNVRVEGGLVHWSERLALPARPMIGVIGVAPVAGAVLTIDNGTHGGNMDVQEVTNGHRLMLRVHHEGAQLFVGDVHALQGDGEVNGMGAIEIRGHLTLSVDLSPAPSRLSWPRIETPTHICTVGCARPLDDALRIAFEEMVFWLEEDYGIPAAEGYMLLGQVAEARCTQMVNPKYSYICKFPRAYLPGRRG